MERIRKSLVEGVELIVNRTEQFKTGLLSVTLTVPLKAETATANALIPDVLYRGSRNHPDIESLSAATDQLYGASFGPAVRQRGECQCVSFLCSFIDDQYALDGMAVLEPAAALMGEVLLDPLTEHGVFRRDYVSGEGANLADRIRSRVNDKRGWSIFRLVQEMCAGEAYALDKLGSAEEAESMTPETLWEQYQTLLKQAQVVFYYGGSADAQRVETAIRHGFGPLISRREGQYACQIISHPASAVREVVDRMDVTQGKLALGFRTGGITMESPYYPALMVCNALYGGTAHSKLFMNVRERMSLCYSVSSMLDKLKGVMVVSSGVEFADFDRAKEEILAQLDAIRRGDITTEERDAAVRAVVNGLVSQKDSQGQMEDYCVTRFLVSGELGGSEELRAAVEAVTVEQIAQVAGTISLDTVYYLTGKEAD